MNFTRPENGLTSERLSSLKGRKIIVFPGIRISLLLEDSATPEDRAAHIDLAYWLLKYLEKNYNQKICRNT